MPNGKEVTIRLPEVGAPSYAEQFDEVLAGLEQVYPFMGMRPGIVVCSATTAERRDTTAEAMLDVAADVQLFFWNQIKDSTPAPGINSLLWGVHDVIPQVQMMWNVFTEGATAAFSAPQSGLEQDWEAFWDPTYKRLGAVQKTGTPSDATIQAFAVVLWWPPSEYAHVVTQNNLVVKITHNRSTMITKFFPVQGSESDWVETSTNDFVAQIAPGVLPAPSARAPFTVPPLARLTSAKIFFKAAVNAAHVAPGPSILPKAALKVRNVAADTTTTIDVDTEVFVSKAAYETLHYFEGPIVHTFNPDTDRMWMEVYGEVGSNVAAGGMFTGIEIFYDEDEEL